MRAAAQCHLTGSQSPRQRRRPFLEFAICHPFSGSQAPNISSTGDLCRALFRGIAVQSRSRSSCRWKSTLWHGLLRCQHIATPRDAAAPSMGPVALLNSNNQPWASLPFALPDHTGVGAGRGQARRALQSSSTSVWHSAFRWCSSTRVESHRSRSSTPG
jgi:hypothetical protein